MSDLASATAAPSIVKAGGLEYELFPLGLRDIGRIDNWAREDNLRLTRQSITAEEARRKEYGEPILPESQVRMQWAECYSANSRISVLTRGSRGYLQCAEVILLLIWLSMRKGKPSVTLEQVDAMLPADKSELTVITTEILVLSGFMDRELAGNPEALAAAVRKAAEAETESGN